MTTRTIVLVEDNAGNRMVIVDVLEGMGHHVLAFENAEEALDIVRSEITPDLVLIDIQLPGMDGLTATRILREDPSMAQVPIIALTSFAMEGDRERCLVAGCSGFMTKPLRIAAFRREIAQTLERSEREMHR